MDVYVKALHGGSDSAGTAGGGTGGVEAGLALAAVRGQVTQQSVHPFEGRAIDQVPAVALLGHQVGVGQLLEMEGQTRRGNIELLAKRAGRQAGGTGDHECLEDSQPQRLGESSKNLDDVLLFHNSTIVEI